MSNNNKTIDCTISEFYADKNVFITGATGFLGTVLLEALLSSTPKIGNIYVLVRGKYGSDPQNRIDKLLSKAIFKPYSKETLKKVVPLVGELCEPKFGLPDTVYDQLKRDVNVIFHSAATINFNMHLRIAIKTNIVGTLRTIELAKSVDSLASYIYLSTAFCNCNNLDLIEEKIYKATRDPYEMIKLSESTEFLPQKGDPRLKEFILDQPNTYTFTKQLAENLVKRELAGYPVGVVRPSVIYGTYNYPVEGWSGSANSGHLGFLAGFMKGIFRTMCGNPESVLDVIPCDYVVNSTMVLGWYVGTHEVAEPEVIHCTSGQINPLTFANLCKIMNNTVAKNPCDKIVWKPYTKIRNSWRYTLAFYLFHFLPALILYIPEKVFSLGKPHHSSLQYMRVFDKGTKAFEFFLNKNFRYDLKNSTRIGQSLHEKDAERYDFNAKSCDWSTLIERSFKGLRHYYFRESKETTARHHAIWNILVVLHLLGFVLSFFISYWIAAFFVPFELAGLFAVALTWFFIWL